MEIIVLFVILLFNISFLMEFGCCLFENNRKVSLAVALLLSSQLFLSLACMTMLIFINMIGFEGMFKIMSRVLLVFGINFEVVIKGLFELIQNIIVK